MLPATQESMAALYESDETAWLEATAELLRTGQVDRIDFDVLEEYLTDMAKRDRREVENRLVTLIAHLLKYEHQAARRSGSWRATILEQRQELEGLLGRGILRNHAVDVLSRAYAKAVDRAATETELPNEAFPATCPYSLDDVLTAELAA
jgi:Domain of unknown function DUF29